ncbi:hypothetical protein PHYSODRAFT_506586 [Phytophthora sojae]|uniref:Uncharacterized protein n=1 Tax=Phytophthora sojae (strain P6497) TaxID=1094619 RepID=G4ZNQ6_PHYSP|nr:hypothetical protein PHYSODRAFT_506586 [Phytophthora sojae]EGZ15079.1 hypothetical protein PHYSODRAFT_506586 [Phytophthora sojae]|eukprot:XP_009528828.1 hypothetical protein PHYSODRAFT_506586 [Phytophthora sojae]
MSNIIILSSQHIVSNGYNNTLRYEFPGSSVNFTNSELAIHSINMYNSQFNIDASAYGNNSFKLSMPTGNTYSTVQIRLPSGYYSYSAINSAMQSAMISAGAYLISADGDNVFYANISENPTYYSCQVDLSPVPTSLPAGWSRPPSGLYSSGGTGLPLGFSYVPKLVIDNEEFGKIIGFPLGTTPSQSLYTLQSVLSPIPPQINPVSSYQMQCSLVSNPFCIPDDILTTFNTAGTTIGQLVSYQPNEFCWVDVPNGSYASITLTIVDQEGRFAKLNDTNMLISLIVRQKRS